MAAPTLAQIREGLATRLETIPEAQVSAYRLARPSAPSIQVLGPDEVNYHEAMQNGHDSWVLTVMAVAGTTTDKGAQIVLDKFIGATGTSSVKAAIEGDATLAGVVNDLIVESCTGYRLYAIEGKEMLGAEWRVRIEADGS